MSSPSSSPDRIVSVTHANEPAGLKTTESTTTAVAAIRSAQGPKAKGSTQGSSSVDRRSFLEWLSEEPVPTTAKSSGTLASDEAAVANWVVGKHPMAWETPAHLKANVSTTVAVPVISTPQPAPSTASAEPPDKVQSADELDRDDLALLQKVLEPTGHLVPWAVPPSVQVAQAWVNEATDQAGNTVAGASGAKLSGQMERLLRWSAASGKSVRVVIDESLAVILRIRQGRVSADFVPQGVQSAEVASRLAAMQNQLDELKQRLASQNLPVDAVRARMGRPYQPPPQQDESSQSQE